MVAIHVPAPVPAGACIRTPAAALAQAAARRPRGPRPPRGRLLQLGHVWGHHRNQRREAGDVLLELRDLRPELRELGVLRGELPLQRLHALHQQAVLRLLLPAPGRVASRREWDPPRTQPVGPRLHAPAPARALRLHLPSSSATRSSRCAASSGGTACISER